LYLKASPRKFGRGFTIIEVLVFSSILLVLMGSIALVVQGGMRYMRTGTAYQDAQKQVIVGMQKLREDLARSTPARRAPLSPLVDSDHLIFPSPVPDTPDQDWTYDEADLEYHSWVCYYHDAADSELVRVEVPLSGPLKSNELDEPPDLSAFKSPPSGSTTKVVARDIVEFLLNDGPTGQQVSVRMAASVKTGTKKNTTVVSRSMVTMPNR
jgi:hypothetical protein